MNLESLIPALLLLPLGGFLITAAIGRRLHKQAHWIPVLAIAAVWVIAMLLVVNVLTGTAPLLAGSETHGYAFQWFTWIPAGNFVVDVGFVVDPLTACLLIVVTTTDGTILRQHPGTAYGGSLALAHGTIYSFAQDGSSPT